ncbi:MAG: peptidoglycan bridge formation glycyltransferase FemA/FemB family protein [Deltaproteobacteria bacterium]|nr:peptidoglycan bridge formation glycyltransferase FemA/FemB family protein [Deltaproteobacteria bacterium]
MIEAACDRIINLNFKALNPVSDPNWNNLVVSCNGYTPFHVSGWCRALEESYQYQPLYISMLNHGKIQECLPIMEVRSILTGKRGISLPFTDYCEPILSNNGLWDKIFRIVVKIGKEKGWRYIELRDIKFLPAHIPPFVSYYGHTLDLTQGSDKVFSKFRCSTRRNIKKAIKEGVEAEIFNSIEALREFYRLNCMTRKRHGLPPQPFYFFKKLFEHMISKNQGFIVLCSHGGENIAGAVFLHFCKKAVYKYGASDVAHQNLRANNLVMWKAIEWYSQNNFETFCFGRTEIDNKGLLQFKSGWGAEERIINYYRYDLKKEKFVAGAKNGAGFSHGVFSRMPIPLLRIAGALLYRHVG